MNRKQNPFGTRRKKKNNTPSSTLVLEIHILAIRSISILKFKNAKRHTKPYTTYIHYVCCLVNTPSDLYIFDLFGCPRKSKMNICMYICVSQEGDNTQWWCTYHNATILCMCHLRHNPRRKVQKSNPYVYTSFAQSNSNKHEPRIYVCGGD